MLLLWQESLSEAVSLKGATNIQPNDLVEAPASHNGNWGLGREGRSHKSNGTVGGEQQRKAHEDGMNGSRCGDTSQVALPLGHIASHTGFYGNSRICPNAYFFSKSSPGFRSRIQRCRTGSHGDGVMFSQFYPIVEWNCSAVVLTAVMGKTNHHAKKPKRTELVKGSEQP